MSTTSTGDQASASATGSSAWSRGPPTSNTSSANHSGNATPARDPNFAPNGAGVMNGASVSTSSSAPLPIGGHSRKGSLMVGGGIDIKRGSLAFGTVDSPNPHLSSSPAAPSTTGAHLSDTVKSFGSIEADASTDPTAVKASRRQSSLSGPTSPPAPAKKLELHALFGKPSNLSQSTASQTQPVSGDRRQSFGQNNGYPHVSGHYSSAQAGQFRPPPQNVPRSPVPGQQPSSGSYSTQPQVQHGFRPTQPNMPNPMLQQRPNGMPSLQPGIPRPNMMMNQQNVGAYGMHPGPQGPGYMMNYPQGYYYGQYDQSQYGMAPQWGQPQQQASVPISPRPSQAQITSSQPSPAPVQTPLPSVSGGPSPAPTPPNRPPSLISPHQSTSSVPSLPGTPSRNMPAPFTTPFGLSGGAASFTPRKSAAVKFSRPDGTAVDIKQAAAAAKGPETTSSSGVITPEPEHPEPVKKKVPALPVIVRVESEEQKRQRLEEAARLERIRKVEEEEAKERQERKERLAREEEKRQAEEKIQEEEREREAKRLAEVEDAKHESAESTTQNEELGQPDVVPAEQMEGNAESAAKEAPLSQIPSTSASPLSSPVVEGVGLPPKPINALKQRPVPSPLEIRNEEDSPLSAIASAKPIADLASVTYTPPIQSPRPDLNVDAQPGKYRYDRDFLMQFMAGCREKPDGLPPLEEIGLEADTSSGFGGRSGRGGPRSSVGGHSRSSGGAGLGIGGINRPMPGQGMGSFGMGNFGSGALGTTRGTSSEDRYARSLAQGRLGNMGRSPSQQGGLSGMHGLPSMTSTTSRGGGPRSQRGTKRQPQPTFANPEPGVAPLIVSNNAWVTQRGAGANDEKSPAFIERKVKALLNKLTEEKFDSISKQILEWANKSANEKDGMTLKLVIKLVFEKATDEAHWSSMYAKLCRLLLVQLDPEISEKIDGKVVSGGVLFRKYLIGRCQLDFESGWKAREDAASAAAAKSAEDRERLAQQDKNEEGSEPAILSDEYYAAQKAKRRGLGLVQLIGELFKMEMLTKNVIRQCFVRLLGNVDDPDEEDIESACKLLTTVGAQYETVSHDNMSVVFERLNYILKQETIASRIRFMIMDVIDMRKNKWQSKNKQAGVMTIAEIHQQAAKEQAEKAVAASRESLSRGGSRAGHSRRDGPQPGEWQSVNATARPLQRPTDFTNIGRNISSSGLPSAPTFNPQSAFKRKGNNAAATPPISRQPSTNNMFNVLSGETVASNEAAEPLPERKKLNLAPRTRPIEGTGSEDEVDDDEEADEDVSEHAEDTLHQSTTMTEAEAKTKISLDMKELWGDKGQGGSRNPEDIVHYFRALPDNRRLVLVETLLEELFRMSKLNNAEVLAKGWKLSIEQDVVNKDVLMQGLENRMLSLDDDSIDFPQAYKAVGTLFRGLSLSAEEIEVLVEKVDVYGEPKITPKMKMERALTSLDEEAAKS